MIRDPETLNALLDSLRRFVRERLIPAENEVAETDHIPDDIVQQMKAMGLFGLTIPEAYGGLRADHGRGSRSRCSRLGRDVARLPLGVRHHGRHRLAWAS